LTRSYGKVSFGKQAVKDGRLTRLIDHPDEAPWLAKIFAWYGAGIQLLGLRAAPGQLIA